jgi:glycosyltransferase involved in cell wall biosynthesis
MKILHVSQGYTPAIGGTEKVVQRLSEELVRQFDDEVTVFTTNCYNAEAFYTPHLPRMAAGAEVINGVRIRRFEVRSQISRILRLPQWVAYQLNLPGNQYLRIFSAGPIIPGLRNAIQKCAFDVMMATSFPLLHTFTAARAAERARRPYALQGNLHPQDTWSFGKPAIYKTINRAPCYIANTDYEARYVISRGAIPSRVTTIGIGVDLEQFERVSSDEAKQRLGFSGNTVVGFIGQIAATKGVDTLVRAMGQVWDEFPDVHLLIAGSRTLFSDQIENLLRAINRLGHKQVHLIYNFPEEEKPFLFSAVDVFAYPSGYESFGIAFLEAWSCKKPVIGCRRGAISSVVEAGKDGLLVEYQNDVLLAEAIRLILRNPFWAREMGQAGYEKVRQRFTWPEIARKYREVYQVLVKGRGPDELPRDP